MNGAESIDPLITSDQIARRVHELGACITDRYAGCPLTLLGVLRGATVFLADLARAVDLPLQLDFVALSSYAHGTETSGKVKLLQPAHTDLANRDILIVEDIVDTGLTLTALIEYLAAQKPRSIAVCALLSKPSRRRVEVAVDYIGFEIPDEFVVGYGLDHAERYRNLPYIGRARFDFPG